MYDLFKPKSFLKVWYKVQILINTCFLYDVYLIDFFLCNLSAAPCLTWHCLKLTSVSGELTFLSTHENRTVKSLLLQSSVYLSVITRTTAPTPRLGLYWVSCRHMGLVHWNFFLWVSRKPFCCWAGLMHTFHLSTIIRISIPWIYIEPLIQRGQSILI